MLASGIDWRVGGGFCSIAGENESLFKREVDRQRISEVELTVPGD